MEKKGRINHRYLKKPSKLKETEKLLIPEKQKQKQDVQGRKWNQSTLIGREDICIAIIM